MAKSAVLNTLRARKNILNYDFDDVDDATIAEWTGLSRSRGADAAA